MTNVLIAKGWPFLEQKGSEPDFSLATGECIFKLFTGPKVEDPAATIETEG